MVEGVSIEQPKPSETQPKPQFDAVLVFGQGPVIGKESRLHAASSSESEADVNFWSKEVSIAAKTLYDQKQIGKVMVMGGQTGGEGYPSEAALIAKPLEDAGVPVEMETRSTNTLENLVNLINEHPEIMEPGSKLAILGADFHLSRIRQLMEMFEIPYAGVFSAEAVAKYAALPKEGDNQQERERKEQMLNELDRRLDINADSKTPTIHAPGYYSQQEGTEARGVLSRTQDEYFLARALIEQPKYWVGYLGGIEKDEIMMRLLRKQHPDMLKNTFGVDLEKDSPQLIREKLKPYTNVKEERIVPPAKKWIRRGWRETSAKKLEEIVDRRNAASATGKSPTTEE